MKRDAFGAIDLLIGLVLTTIVFLTKSVKEQVDAQVNEIENMRQQTINYEQNSQNENY